MKHTNTTSLMALCMPLAVISVEPVAARQITPPKPIEIRIDAQRLDKALNLLARQAGFQILTFSDDALGKMARPINGRYTYKEALDFLLHETDLTYQQVEDGVFAVRSRSTDGDEVRKITYNEDSYYQENLAVIEEDEKEEVEFEEIVVTGSHIRGVGPVGSQVFTYDRGEIDIQGYSTLPQFIQSLPQNFNGGPTEATLSSTTANGANTNFNAGTSINLRGLGTVSTLVLLDGQRLAPVGQNGNFVDISLIPLSAIERVEVLTDGASSIYGSDAIGGVVNFKMRKDYDGAETRLRYGGATEGGLKEFLFGQTFGKTWDRGYGLVSYEYSQRDRLDTKDRSFSEDAFVPTDLIPDQERHSVFLTGGHGLTEGLDIFATAYYNNRDSERRFTHPPSGVSPTLSISETEQYGATLGTLFDLDSILGKGWRAEVVGVYNRSEFIQESTLIDVPDDEATLIGRVSKNLSADAKIDGPLFTMAGGMPNWRLGDITATRA